MRQINEQEQSSQNSGVALALFRDGLDSAARDGDRLIARQGEVTATVYLWR